MDPIKSHKSLPSNEQAELIRQLIGGDVCIVWRMNNASDWLDVIGWGSDEEPDYDYINGIKLALKPSSLRYFQAERTSLFLKNVSSHQVAERYMYQGEAIKRGWKSLISTPLFHHDRLVGLVDTYWHRVLKKSESTAYQKNLWSVSRLAARSIMTPLDTRPMLPFEAFLPEFTKLNVEQFSLDEKLEIIVNLAREMLNAKCAKLYWRIPDTRQLVLKIISGIPSGVRKVGDSLEEGEGLAGEVLKINNPKVVLDYDTYENRLSWLSKNSEAVIAVPIRQNGHPIGVLEVFDHKGRRFFEVEDIPLLMRLADLADAHIRNQDIIDGGQKRMRDLEMVEQVIHEFNARLETDQLLNTVTEMIKKQLGCNHCTIFLPEKEGKRDLLYAAHTSEVDADRIKSRRFYRDQERPGLMWGVFEKGQTEIFHDATKHDDFAPARANEDKGRSLLIAPMKVEGRIVGIICADQDERVFFKEDDKPIVNILAKHAGMAIERQSAVETMEKSSQLIVEKINQEKLDKILGQIIDSARKLTQMDSGVIHIIKWDGDNPYIDFTHKSPEFATYPAPRVDSENHPIGLTRRVIDTEEPVIVPNTFHSDGIRAELAEVHHSCIGLPLFYGEVVIGTLFLDDDKPHTFHEAELLRLNTLVNFAAAAIRNAQQFENHLKAIDEIAQVIAVPLDIKAVQERILSWTNLLMDDASLSVLALVDEEKNEISAYVKSGQPVQDNYRRTIKIGEGIVGRVAKTGEPVLLNDVALDGAYKPLRDDISSELAVPIFIGGKVKGVLDINHPKKNAFTNVDLQQATAIARLSGLAFTNADMALKLFEQIVNTCQKRAIDLVTTDILHNVTNLVGTIPGWVNDIREILDSAGTFEEKGEAYQLLDKIDRDISVIESQTRRSWPSSISSDNLDLASLAGDIIGELKAAFGSLIVFNFVYDHPTSYILKGVELNVREVIYNTLYNSVQAILKKGTTDRNGRIDVRLSRERINESEKIILMIIDNGVGISPEKRDHIFQLSTGFGISTIGELKYGLWRSQSILNDMGGDIKLLDAPQDVGSTFRITLNT